MNKRILILLFGILCVATILRFYELTKIPPSLEWDEVATGYDAYSILKTGRDQYGTFLPLTIRSIDDYKPPLYTYLAAASIAIFGWNDFAIRFPAAFLGVLAIWTTYGMTRKLFKNEKVALLSALLLAISPWHVNFSRLALETNSTIFFTTAATWTFLIGLEIGPLLIVSAALFGADLFLYHNARVFVPFFGLLLVLFYFKNLLNQKKWVIAAGIIISICIIRLIPILTSIEGQMRFNGTSIFTPNVAIDVTEAKNTYAEWRVIDTAAGVGIYGKLFHNRFVFYGLRILKNYLSHFNPTFWLFTTDSPRHHMPEMGIVYFIELPFIILGWYFLWKRKQDKRSFILLLVWFLLAPVPASVTQDVPHALRSEILLPTLQISAAAAMIGMYYSLQSYRRTKLLFFGLLLLGYFLSVSFFLHQFLFHFAESTSMYWQYGRKEAAEYADSIKDMYDRVIVSRNVDQPLFFFLYYLKYDPVKYLAEGGTVSGGWAEERNHFDKYYFQTMDYEKMRDAKTLFVGVPKDFPPDAHILHKVRYLDGTDAVWIAD